MLSVTGTVVFEYETPDSLPQTKLSVFVQTEYEAQRASSFEIKSERTGLVWKIDSPQIFSNGNRNWAGYSVLLPVENEKTAPGLYRVKYCDAAGNEDETSFVLSFREELFNAKSDEIKNHVAVTLNENTVLYDENMEMLYYGKPKSIWTSNEEIVRDYNKSHFMRKTLSTASGNLLFLLPLENLVEEESSENEEISENEETPAGQAD